MWRKEGKARTSGRVTLPGLLQIQKGGPEAIGEAIAGGQHAVVDQQPTRAGLDGDRPGADLGGLPAANRAHHVAVAAPIPHIRAFTVEDIAEGRMAIVRGAAEHGIYAVDLAREQHAVAVVKAGARFPFVRGLEVAGLAHADGGAVVAVAPGHVIAVFQPQHARVIAVHELVDFRCLIIFSAPLDALVIQLPMDAVHAPAGVQLLDAYLVIAAENAGELALEWHHRAVEDAVG